MSGNRGLYLRDVLFYDFSGFRVDFGNLSLHECVNLQNSIILNIDLGVLICRKKTYVCRHMTSS